MSFEALQLFVFVVFTFSDKLGNRRRKRDNENKPEEEEKKKEPVVTKGEEREEGCLGCVRSLLRGRSNGACYNAYNEKGKLLKRCFQCAYSKSC